jgi:hypothetical protein
MTSSSIATLRTVLTASSLALALAACTSVQPQSAVSRELSSGVTSSNGGGMVPANFSTFGASTPGGRSFDTGNMAYPEPLAQGALQRTRVQ